MQIKRTCEKTGVALVFFFLFTTVSAQPRYWRVGVAYQTGESLRYFKPNVSFPGQYIAFDVRPAETRLITGERDLNRWLRINLGVGQTEQSYVYTAQEQYQPNAVRSLPNGRVIAVSPGPVLYGSIGLTAHTPTYGPFTWSAGLDVLTRRNLSAQGGTTGGNLRVALPLNNANLSNLAGLTEGVDYLIIYNNVSYENFQVPTFTVAVSPRAGVDMQLFPRISLYVGAVATLGLQPLVKGQANIDMTGRKVQADYEHRGSFWGLQVGAKYHFWRGRSAKGLHF